LCFTAFSAVPGRAQGFRWPDNPENMQVLEATGSRLGQIMRGFTSALGVRCEYCHVHAGPDPGDLTTFAFESDEKPAKEMARLMIQMVQAINGTHLAEMSVLGVPDEERITVTCVTCHRGARRPRMIEDVIAEVLDAEGIEAAEARYRELRDEYFGGFVYDFRPGPLSSLAEGLARGGRSDDAVALLELEAELNPTSYSTYFTLSQVLIGAGRTEEAIEALERSLEHAPDRSKGFIRRQLDRLRGGG